MILDKVAQQGGIRAVGRNGADHVVEIADAATGRLKRIEKLIVSALVSIKSAPKS
jgi:hypothetical protein